MTLIYTSKFSLHEEKCGHSGAGAALGGYGVGVPLAGIVGTAGLRSLACFVLLRIVLLESTLDLRTYVCFERLISALAERMSHLYVLVLVPWRLRS